MNILADFHHAGLYASFHYLFENRLGCDLYRPIGREWFERGYWKIAEPYGNYPGTIDQFLQIRSVPEDGTIPLNDPIMGGEGIYCIEDKAHYYAQRAMTFDRFMEHDIDIIIASIPAHIPTYKQLIKKYKPNAKLVFHIGNIGWGEMLSKFKAENIMASIKEIPIPEGKNMVFYRQEFDLEVFKPTSVRPKKIISSFVHPAQSVPIYWGDMVSHLPKYKCNDYQYSIQGTTNIADKMQQSKFGYHYKPGGDGFGHIIHNWLAVGKPVIVNLDDYKDKLTGELLIDGKTCIDLSIRSPKEVADIVREMPDKKYREMCQETIRTFNSTVDFKRDSERVKEFLNNLL